MSGLRHCPIVDRAIEEGACYDVGAHAFRMVDLTRDKWIIELLGDLRFDREALGKRCEACPHNSFRS